MPDESCPQSGGRLIEKHEELEPERRRRVVSLFYRCVRCGKWVKRGNVSGQCESLGQPKFHWNCDISGGTTWLA